MSYGENEISVNVKDRGIIGNTRDDQRRRTRRTNEQKIKKLGAVIIITLTITQHCDTIAYYSFDDIST